MSEAIKETIGRDLIGCHGNGRERYRWLRP
jgi:hypothetical protein